MRKRKVKKINKKKTRLLIFILLCIIIYFISMIKIINYLIDTNKNSKVNKIINNAIKINEDKSTASQDKYIVDFNKLKEQNSDTVAYLKVFGTDIDYVVVKSNDNSYYLNHNFMKEKNSGGWIFADYHNKFDNTDKNIIIYGHNMANGSMFGTLSKVLDKEWQNNKENYNIILSDEFGTKIYKVFSTYMTEPDDYYIKTEFDSLEEYSKFINEIAFRSNYVYGIDVFSSDKILTLSTCNSIGNKRIVLHAKLIKK